jgi:hypothetical protein
MGLPVVTGLRVVAALAVTAMMITGVNWAYKPAPRVTDPIPLPGFTAPATARAAPDPLRRDTLLPTSCADLLTGSPDLTALLGQPIDSLDAHPIVGLPSASVGQLERLTCTYTQTGHNQPILVLTMAGFTDPTAAQVQRERNLTAERSETLTDKPVTMGTAHATLLTEPGHTLLFLAAGRDTLTADLTSGVVPSPQTDSILTDLAQRILPNLTAPHTGAGTPIVAQH